eukprot:SAG11_NODE_2413_length_3392_cov_2.367750_2_plen_246_part_00
MKVAELRRELIDRGLESHGKKADLVMRLDQHFADKAAAEQHAEDTSNAPTNATSMQQDEQQQANETAEKCPRIGEMVQYSGSAVTVTSVNIQVPRGEDPLIAVQMKNGTVRDTTLSRLRPEITPPPVARTTELIPEYEPRAKKIKAEADEGASNSSGNATSTSHAVGIVESDSTNPVGTPLPKAAGIQNVIILSSGSDVSEKSDKSGSDSDSDSDSDEELFKHPWKTKEKLEAEAKTVLSRPSPN